MADFQTGMYSLANQVNPTTEVKAGFDLGKDIQESGYKMQQLGQQTQEATQAFQDRQAARQALQQNVDAFGNLDKHAALVQVAKQNPILAQQMDLQMKKYGIEGAAAHAERFQEFYANTTPETYKQDKQKLIDEGIDEAKQLPDYLPEKSRLRGLLTTGSAAQQMDVIKATSQREMDLKKTWIEQNGSLAGYPEGKDLADIYGLKKPEQGTNQDTGSTALPTGGEVPPANQFSKRDVKAQEEVQKDLGNRSMGDDYKTAKGNLLAIKNVKGLIYSHEDMNKVTNTMIPMVVTEAAKVMKGGVPTKEEFEAMSPENRQMMTAQLISKMTGQQVPADQQSYLKMIDNYMSDLQKNSQEVMRAHHRDAINTGLAAGMNHLTAKKLTNSKEKFIQDLSSNTTKKESSNPQVQAAEAWLNSPSAKSAPPEKIQMIKDRINQLKGQR